MAVIKGYHPIHRLSLVVCALVLLVMVVVNIGAGQSSSQPKKQGVLLLTNNRLVEGRISQSAGGYVVDKKYGTLVIPFDQVRLTARDRGEAFRKLKATLPKKSANINVELARWCLSNQLHSECRAELRDALALEPEREDARKMLKRVEEILNPSKPVHLSKTKSPRRTRDGFLSQEAKSLAGLSPESARRFVIKVQPLLMNKCGNASCHGTTAKNEFRLIRVRFGRGSHRVFSEKNLAVTLKYIDLITPDNSPLLRISKGNHGRRGQAIFHGPQGAAQWNTLREWVIKVSKELPAPAHKKQSLTLRKLSPLKKKQTKFSTAGNPVENRFKTNSLIEQTSGVSLPSGRNNKKTSKADENDLIEKILKEERQDAFDPEEFNNSSKKNDP